MLGPGRLSSETEAERMAAGGFYSFVAKVAVRLTSIVNSIVIVRALGLYDLGVLSIVLLLVAVGSVVASLGLPQAIVKFLSDLPQEHSEQASRLLGAALVLTFLATVGTTTVLIVTSPLLATAVYAEPLLAILLPIAALSLVVSGGLSPAFATIQAYERIRELGRRDVLASILSVPTTIGLVLAFGLLGAVFGSVANAMLGVIVRVRLLRSIWKSHGLRFVVPRGREPYRKLMNYALPGVAAGLLVTPSQWLASTILAVNSSFVELGRYAVGLSLTTYLLFVSDSIAIPFLPVVSRLSRENPSRVSSFLLRTLRITTFLLLPPTLCIILFPEPILTLLFGSKGSQSAPVAALLAPAIFFSGLAAIVGCAIAGIGRMWDGLAINAAWGIVFLTLSLFLVPDAKEVGLAAALLLAYAIHYLVTIAYASWRWSIRVWQFAPSSLLAIGFLSLSLLANQFRPLPSLYGVAFLVVVLVVEIRSMSRREREVLAIPLRRFLGWLDRSP